ncbi:MAG: sensor histidine kinase [Flavobacteriales bacterium]|nr:sensor histidine kinase [Flavobacteriales bacterium]
MVHGLLTNASKFSATGSEIRLFATKEEGWVILCVDDHGVGLAPEEIPELFVRYAWLSSRSTAGEGQARSTLARARQCAHLHQGSLDAESEGIGKGMRFTLRLPAI